MFDDVDFTKPLINARGSILKVLDQYIPRQDLPTKEIPETHRYVVQEVDRPQMVYVVDGVGTPIVLSKFPSPEFGVRNQPAPPVRYVNCTVRSARIVEVVGEPLTTLEGAKAAAAAQDKPVIQYRMVPVMPSDPDADPTRVAYCVIRPRGDRLDVIHAYSSPADAALRSIGERGSVIATMTWDDR